MSSLFCNIGYMRLFSITKSKTNAPIGHLLLLILHMSIFLYFCRYYTSVFLHLDICKKIIRYILIFLSFWTYTFFLSIMSCPFCNIGYMRLFSITKSKTNALIGHSYCLFCICPFSSLFEDITLSLFCICPFSNISAGITLLFLHLDICKNFLMDLQSMFDHMVDMSEPICQKLDSHLTTMIIFDTSGIEAWVTENNPKYQNTQTVLSNS